MNLLAAVLCIASLILSMVTVDAPAIRLMRPVNAPIMQVFGVGGATYARWGQRGHNGIDFRAPVGTPVLAAASGVVAEIGYQEDGYGRYVILSHQGGFRTLYAHLSRVDVKWGQKVGLERVLGLSGISGAFGGMPHLHFELRVPGDRLPGYPDGARDPKPYFVTRIVRRPVAVERLEQ